MLDYLNQEIHEGDTVIATDQRYNAFITGKVTKLTAKTVFIEIIKAAGNIDTAGKEVKRTPSQCIVTK